MIPVAPAPEPSRFKALVHDPGFNFLKSTPNPTSWDNRDYWRRAIPDLRNAYQGVCAYSCHWIAHDTGANTVEHFIPKAVDPSKAYDWDNYRFVCSRLNGRKSNFQDVLDPFTLNPDTFVLKFPSMLIAPNRQLSDSLKSEAYATIARLKLNDDDTCVVARLEWLLAYCENKLTFVFLQEVAPFIAYELTRQGLVDDIAEMMLHS